MTITNELDVIYDASRQLKTDLYFDAEQTPFKGAVIDIHGGGWFRGDKSKDADWANRLAGDGYFVFVPNYRYAPDVHFPEAHDDLDRFYQWLKTTSYPFDKQHIAVVGSSAGGNMAVLMAEKYGIPAVSLSGILDIADWLASHDDVIAQEGDTSHFNSTASAQINQTGHNDPFYKWFILNYFDDNPADYRAGTPRYHVTSQTGPLFLANSLNEFVPNSGILDLSTELVKNDIPFTTRFLTGNRHAKGYLEDVYAETKLFLDQFI